MPAKIFTIPMIVADPQRPSGWRFFRWLFNDPANIPSATLCTDTFWILIYRNLLPNMAGPTGSLNYHHLPTHLDYNSDGNVDGTDTTLRNAEQAIYDEAPISGFGVDGGYILYESLILASGANPSVLPAAGDYYTYDTSYPGQLLSADAAWASANISKLPNFKCLVYLDTGYVPFFPHYLVWGKITASGPNQGKPTDGLYWSAEPPYVFEPVDAAADTFNQVTWIQGQDYMRDTALSQLPGICGAVPGFEFAGTVDWQNTTAAKTTFDAAYTSWKQMIKNQSR